VSPLLLTCHQNAVRISRLSHARGALGSGGSRTQACVSACTSALLLLRHAARRRGLKPREEVRADGRLTFPVSLRSISFSTRSLRRSYDMRMSRHGSLGRLSSHLAQVLAPPCNLDTLPHVQRGGEPLPSVRGHMTLSPSRSAQALRPRRCGRRCTIATASWTEAAGSARFCSASPGRCAALSSKFLHLIIPCAFLPPPPPLVSNEMLQSAF
jgi:hypothetical protein